MKLVKAMERDQERISEVASLGDEEAIFEVAGLLRSGMEITQTVDDTGVWLRSLILTENQKDDEELADAENGAEVFLSWHELELVGFVLRVILDGMIHLRNVE